MEAKGYSSLWKAIIRPPKDEYDMEDLGPKLFSLEGGRFERTDIVLKN
jgi:alpha-beta hydrolase superfamily lysophospholipase